MSETTPTYDMLALEDQDDEGTSPTYSHELDDYQTWVTGDEPSVDYPGWIDPQLSNQVQTWYPSYGDSGNTGGVNARAETWQPYVLPWQQQQQETHLEVGIKVNFGTKMNKVSFDDR